MKYYLLISLIFSMSSFASGSDNHRTFKRLSCFSSYQSITYNLDLYYDTDGSINPSGEIIGIYSSKHLSSSTASILIRDIDFKTSPNDHTNPWFEHFSFGLEGTNYEIIIHPSRGPSGELGMVGKAVVENSEGKYTAEVKCNF